MTNIKVVCGANFGDEGKGQMTDYFCDRANTNKEKCLVVLSNGGSQRSHTVTTPEGIRHAFRHFGSGTFVGADTYYPEQFIVNPIFFKDEYLQLKSLGYKPKAYINPDCMFATPFDMIINQIVEEHRGDNRHGSCGMGIWETIVRNGIRVGDFDNIRDEDKIIYLQDIRDKYLPKRLKELGVENINEKWKDIINSKALILNYVLDFNWMSSYSVFTDNYVLKEYDSIVFENGQGLLLDQNIQGYGEHTTPSNTGSKNPLEIINSVFREDEYDLELCYVTRTYITRHGAGRLDNECKKEDINSDIVDLTNVPNPHQGSLRYGKLDVNELVERIKNDSKGVNCNVSLAITHLNEYHLYVSSIQDYFDKLYISGSPNRNNIYKIDSKR